MKVKVFIAATFSILGTWLASAYVYEVDMTSYPRLGKGSRPFVGELDQHASESEPTDNKDITTK